MSEEKRFEIEFREIGKEYPRILLEALYDMADRRFKMNTPSFKKDFNEMVIWASLRSVHHQFLTKARSRFNYYTDFRHPKVYEPKEVIVHLTEMIGEFEGYNEAKNAFLDTRHLGNCNYHFEAVKIAVFSFLEEIQGISFGENFFSKYIDLQIKLLLSIFLSSENMLGDDPPFEVFGVNIEKDGSEILKEHLNNWDREKSALFFKKYIIPIIKEDPEHVFDSKEILAAIAKMESGNQ